MDLVARGRACFLVRRQAWLSSVQMLAPSRCAQTGVRSRATFPGSGVGQSTQTPLVQVLPDLRGGATKAPGILKDGGAELVRQKLAKFFRSRKSAGAKARSKNITLKQRRLANKYSLLATDNAIQGGIGVAGLSQFCTGLPVGKLPRGSRRFFVPTHKLPQPLQATAGGRTCRSCVRDASGATRLEVPWSEPRPSIHWTIDQGSIGWPANVFLLIVDSPKKLRGWSSMNPAHRRHNNVNLALSKASVMWSRDEVLCLQSLTAAPYGAKSHFSVLREAANQMFLTLDHLSDFFGFYYPEISFQVHGGRLPGDFGSAEPRLFMWDFCAEAWAFKRPGTSSKAGRWFQVFYQSRPMRPYWKLLEMVLAFVGLHQEWLNYADDFEHPPLLSTIARLDAAAGVARASGPAEVADQLARASVGGSNRAMMSKLMSRCRNYFHVVYCIYKNTALRSLWILIEVITEPVRIAHGQTLVACDSRLGGSLWEIDLATGKYSEEVTMIAGAIGDQALMQECQLDSICATAAPFLHPQVQVAICEAAWRYAM